MTSLKWDLRFLALAQHIAQWSKDPSTKVGAVIVNEGNRVVSLGFNGFPQAMVDLEDHLTDREKKYSRIVHGEINALIFAERPVRGMTLYTYPFMPCDRCAVQVIQNGIARVVAPKCPPEKEERWREAFNKTRSYFLECGVELVEIE